MAGHEASEIAIDYLLEAIQFVADDVDSTHLFEIFEFFKDLAHVEILLKCGIAVDHALIDIAIVNLDEPACNPFAPGCGACSSHRAKSPELLQIVDAFARQILCVFESVNFCAEEWNVGNDPESAQ